ncbi:MAG: hypothetical protein IK093_08335 [Ruminiclostridium sp.]|nr:hypothetical protein [Ruminiclostridium sp.]
MNVRKLLESHKEIDDRIGLGLEEIAQLRSLAERVTRYISFDESRGKGGHSDRVGDYAVKIAELEMKIDREIDELVALKEKIMKIAGSLDTDLERVIIERRYILHESNEAVAEKLGYSPRHITRMLRNAVEKLEKMYNDEEKIA